MVNFSFIGRVVNSSKNQNTNRQKLRNGLCNRMVRDNTIYYNKITWQIFWNWTIFWRWPAFNNRTLIWWRFIIGDLEALTGIIVDKQICKNREIWGKRNNYVWKDNTYMCGFSAILTVTVVVGFFDSDTLFMVVASENVSPLLLMVSLLAFYKTPHCVR